jgi:hypothetical protein
MKGKTIVSSKEQVAIPTFIRKFFGKGSVRIKGKKVSIKDIDEAIAKAISQSNLKEKS